MQKVEDIAANNISVMKILGKETVEEKVMQLEANASIEYAEPNYIRHIQTFNDTYSGNLRGIPQISGYQAYTIFT